MNLTLGHCALWIDLLAWERDNFAERRCLPGAGLRPVSQFFHRSLATQPAERLVDNDATEPGAEARRAAERRQVGEAAQIGLLQHVLRFYVIADDAAGKAIEPAVVPLHDRAHRRLVAPQRSRDQLCVAGGTEVFGLLDEHIHNLAESVLRRLMHPPRKGSRCSDRELM